MNTWIFESFSDKGKVLICVHSVRFESGWTRATEILREAGHRPVKSNGCFGFSTELKTSHREHMQEGIIDNVLLKSMIEEHAAELREARS